MGTRKTREEMDAQMQALDAAVSRQDGMAQAGLTEEEILAELKPREAASAPPGPFAAGPVVDQPVDQAPVDLGTESILAQLVEPEPGPQADPPLSSDAESALSPEEIQAIESSTETGRIKLLVESLLFAAGDPMTIQTLLPILREIQPLLTSREVKHLLDRLRTELREQGRGLRIVEVASGYQLRTPAEAAPYLQKLVERRPPKLSRAALETLAIVAYRQPATRGEIEDIRGVDSGTSLKQLLEKKMVRILGRKEEVGRPLLYATSRDFLTFFSLKDLNSLPTLRDFTELSEEHRTALGLAPAPKPEEEIVALAEEEAELQANLSNIYAPVGEDEFLQELDQALAAVKLQGRKIDEILPEEDEEGADAGALPAAASPPAAGGTCAAEPASIPAEAESTDEMDLVAPVQEEEDA